MAQYCDKDYWLFIGQNHYEQRLALWYTSSKCLYIKFLRILTRDWECNKKFEENYLEGSAFAIVFLRVKHAGATVLHKQFLTHDISFKIDICLCTIQRKIFIS